MLKNFGYSWPEKFDCSRFPVGGKPGVLCVGDSSQTGFTDDELEHFQTSTPVAPRRPGEYEKMMDFKCPVQLQMPRDMEYKLYIGRDQVR